jgi:flagellar protein FlgJ
MDINANASLNTALALDAQGLSRLKKASVAAAGSDDRNRAIQESARQVEAMFVDSLLKSMRTTRMDSGLFQNPGKDMFEGMLDQQRAQAISARGLGLATVIAQQLKNTSQPAGPQATEAAATQRDKPWSVPSSTLR